MINFKIYNDDRVRRYSYFPTLKDPNILENTLLRILNDKYRELNIPLENKFDINNPKIANTYFTYYTTSNFKIWGQLPMGYIYNDMIRHIQNQNTDKNFILTLESIHLSLNESDYLAQAAKMYLIYELISAYIVENYTMSYNYMSTNANCIMVAYIHRNNDTIVYILSTGFNPKGMAKWYSSSDNFNDPNALPINRYKSLDTIVKTYESHYGINIGPIQFESADGRMRENINNCIREVDQTSINRLRKRSKYDTEVKYGNYSIDYKWIEPYDLGIPACTMIYDNKSKKIEVSRFNQEGEYKDDFRLLEKQQDLIRINEKRNY